MVHRINLMFDDFWWWRREQRQRWNKWKERKEQAFNKWVQQYPRLAFFLFLEKDPQHQVIESADTIIGLFSQVIPIISILAISTFLAWSFFGTIGAAATLIGELVAIIEVPHYLNDR